MSSETFRPCGHLRTWLHHPILNPSIRRSATSITTSPNHRLRARSCMCLTRSRSFVSIAVETQHHSAQNQIGGRNTQAPTMQNLTASDRLIQPARLAAATMRQANATMPEVQARRLTNFGCDSGYGIRVFKGQFSGCASNVQHPIQPRSAFATWRYGVGMLVGGLRECLSVVHGIQSLNFLWPV